MRDPGFLPIPVEFLTSPQHGPRMVSRGAGIVFDYYLLLLKAFHESENGASEVAVSYKAFAEEMGHTGKPFGVSLHRAGCQLRDLYGLVRYEPRRGRHPALQLLDLHQPGAPYRYPQSNYLRLPYEYWAWGWDRKLSLKGKFFLLVSIVEDGLRGADSNSEVRPYWFRSLAGLAERYHVSQRTASDALGELIKRGILKVNRADMSFKRTNRYYYQDITQSKTWQERMQTLEAELGPERFATARGMAERLDLEASPGAVRDFADLVAEFGEMKVLRAIALVGAKSVRFPGRRTQYIRGILKNWENEREVPMAVCEVSVLGYIAVGSPRFAEQMDLGTIRASVPSGARGDLFALLVQGDSMIGAGIRPGDHVVVEKTSAADDGEIVIALVDGQPTLKRLRLKGDHVELEPQHPGMASIRVSSEDGFGIQGRVVAIAPTGVGGGQQVWMNGM